ncbi:Phosphatidylinositol 4,5-bisphosphate 5-phosphatase A [Liparis tanakae]|uniref:phosphoinositide 5-phosphatase n=1 Tax=Liparis tanakae TaxID=230148 RepID=A0A4Z2E839_9TELE|nr:Phosphatidylinositol 4,5-bisphosphate 5-phosphatase A [Liparis tanakae]
MQGLLLLCFSKMKHLQFIRDIQTTYTRTGIYGYWGNKGGVSLRLAFYGHALCFLNCHLAAHLDRAAQRLGEFRHILETQAFPGPAAPRILDHRPPQSPSRSPSDACLCPQLTMMRKKERALQEFEEGPLDFPPTYKFDVDSDTYDSR